MGDEIHVCFTPVALMAATRLDTFVFVLDNVYEIRLLLRIIREHEKVIFDIYQQTTRVWLTGSDVDEVTCHDGLRSTNR